MFRALDQSVGGLPIVSLDPQWAEPIPLAELRGRCRADQICCPWCQAPVVIRAGRIKVRHFAHKHLDECPYANEAAEKLLGRQVLYEWLKTKVESGDIELEVLPDGLELPLPLDVLLHRDSKRFGYWCLHRNIRSWEERDLLLQAVRRTEKSDMHLHVVFSSKLLNLIDDRPELVRLSTTQRDLMHGSQYDTLSGGAYSLHFLAPEESVVTTLRGLRPYEEPQTFQFGLKIESTLADMRVAHRSGEIIHLGEHEAWQEAKRQRLDAEAARREQQRRVMPPQPMTSSHGHTPPMTAPPCAAVDKLDDNAETTIWNRRRSAVCVICKTLIPEDDWVVHYRVDNTCKCRKCMGVPIRKG